MIQADSHLQGSLKRSVTTLRGGTLGYAEIVALKVTKTKKTNESNIFFLILIWC